MVIFYLAAASLLLWIIIWFASYITVRSQGGEIQVDNERDINPRHFAGMLRKILAPALDVSWGQKGEGNWRFDTMIMRRHKEMVGVYHGDLRLGSIPRKSAAIVVVGSLTIEDLVRVDCDIWCTGSVTVGVNCRLRSIAAEGCIELGSGTFVERWLDAGEKLKLGPAVSVVAMVSAGEELEISEGFKGGKVFAPAVRIGPNLGNLRFDREATLAKVAHWTSIRSSRNEEYLLDESENKIWWTQLESVCSTGDFWVGPNSVVLSDLICRGSVQVGDDCIVSGSIHSDKDLLLGRGSLVTGNAACEHLIMETGAIVAGSVHVAGDALLSNGSVVGLSQQFGGLAAIGSVKLQGEVVVSRGITSGNTLLS